jgi:hypothetical protein
MAHTIKFYPVTGGEPTSVYANRPYDTLIETLAEDAMPLGWQRDEDAPYDRAFEDECDRYSSHEMFHGDEAITVLTFDGKMIGTLDAPVPTNLSEYVTAQMREAAE